MKEYISYFYKINVKDIKSIKDDIYFVNAFEGEYIYRKIYNSLNEITELNRILNYYNVKRNRILIGKDGTLVTSYESDNYVLIEIKYNREEYKKIEMPIFIGKGKISIAKKWENNVGKYKILISKNKIRDNNMKRLLNYFIGEAEIAIGILNKIEDKMTDLYLQHKRIYIPNYGINYKDEMNFVVDYKSRDLAELYKTKIIKGYFDNKVFIKDFLMLNLNENEKKYFIARLIYPSHFFEEIEKNNDVTEEEKVVYEIDKIIRYNNIIKSIVELVRIKI